MHKLLVSLDEIERVKRLNKIRQTQDLADLLGFHRNTVRAVIQERKASHEFLQALVDHGARPNKLFVIDSLSEVAA